MLAEKCELHCLNHPLFARPLPDCHPHISALDALYTGLRSPAPLTIPSSAGKAARGGGALMIRAGPVASLRMGATPGSSCSSSSSSSSSASGTGASASAGVSGIAGASGSASPDRFPVEQRPSTHADTALAQQNITRPHSATSFSSRILSDAATLGPSHSSLHSMPPPTLLSSSMSSAQVGSKRRAAAVIDINADCEVEIEVE
jgi:hypothetical protein